MAPFLEQSLQSVVAQTVLPTDVIVVDDGASLEEQNHKAALTSRYGCKFIANVVRRGAAFNRNTGARAATGEYICFLDHDDVLLPRSTEKKLARLRSVPGAGFCYGGYVFIDESGSEVERPAIKFAEGETFCEALARFEIILSPSCALITRQCLEGVGGFDTAPSLFHCEDYDFWLRAALGGWTVAAVPEVLSHWRRHPHAWAHEFTAERIDKALVMLLARAEKKFPGWSYPLRRHKAQALYRLGSRAARQQQYTRAKRLLRGSITSDLLLGKAYVRYLQAFVSSSLRSTNQ